MNPFFLLAAISLSASVSLVTLTAAIWRDVSGSLRTVRSQVKQRIESLADARELDRAAAGLARKTLQFPRPDDLGFRRI